MYSTNTVNMQLVCFHHFLPVSLSVVAVDHFCARVPFVKLGVKFHGGALKPALWIGAQHTQEVSDCMYLCKRVPVCHGAVSKVDIGPQCHMGV